MQIIPALDLRQGRCVRLAQGDLLKETRYSDRPLDMVAQFVDAGANKLHLVNLDGAFGQTSGNAGIIQSIVQEFDISVELGGGIRTLENIQTWLDAGVNQVILGTAAVENSDLVSEAVNRFGRDAIIVGADVKSGQVAVRGWLESSQLSPESFAADMESRGIRRFIFTAVETDGMLCGPDIPALTRFSSELQGSVTASGGISSLEDILALLPLQSQGVDSVITGRALYEGRLDLGEALREISKTEKNQTTIDNFVKG